MKIKLRTILIFVIITSCNRSKVDIDFPRDINEIESINLLKPDNSSNGKFAGVKYLNQNEIQKLVKVLKDAKFKGPYKFIPKYYIEILTKNDGVKRIRVNGNIVKGYKSDIGYEISNLEFLNEFNK